ncbi:MAG TPA: flippase-like domain-containing protein [Gemmatimonadaceae bacterium]|nr:flippase-like domain-containing protein [Gemmatimonadaceae bacterium]
MTFKRWLLTGLSFATVIAVSLYFLIGWSRQEGTANLWTALPPIAHALALGTVLIEVGARALKLVWSARAVDLHLPFGVALRTCLGGDFGAAITPARSGSEPARFLILAESRLAPASVLVILFAELFLEALSLAIVVAVVAVVFSDAGRVLGALVGVVGGYSAFVLGLAVVAVLLSRRNATGPAPRWAQRLWITEGRWQVVQRWLRNVHRTVDVVKDIDFRFAVLSLGASVVHVAIRLAVLPALVLTTAAGANAALAPLALWPLGFLYGAAVVPAPGGGGAVELAFRAALEGVIPHVIFGAALLWWRFYTFYLYILMGGIAAGRTVLRALRKTDQMEEELETAA